MLILQLLVYCSSCVALKCYFMTFLSFPVLLFRTSPVCSLGFECTKHTQIVRQILVSYQSYFHPHCFNRTFLSLQSIALAYHVYGLLQLSQEKIIYYFAA